ncbi:DUF1559 domain-containing protein [bacterium]|nr:DUF1559 domain-containing protein [bacterium]
MRHLLHAILVGFLAATMAFPPQVALAQDAAPPAEKKSELVGLNYVPEDAVWVGYIKADRFLKAPGIEAYPVEVIEAFGHKYFGFNPMKMTSITFFVTPMTPEFPAPDCVTLVKTSETLNPDTFFKNISEIADGMAEEEEIKETFPDLKGQAFYFDAYEFDYIAAHMLDEHTFVIGSMAKISYLLKKGPSDKLTDPAKLLEANNSDSDGFLAFNVTPVREQINGMLGPVQIPPPFTMYKQIPNYTESITLTCNCTQKFGATLKINGVDDAATGRLDDMIGFTLELAKQAMLTQAEQLANSKDEVEAAVGRYQIRTSKATLAAMKPKREGNSLVLHVGKEGEQNPALMNAAVVGILVALLLPAVQQARAAARRMQSVNNLKQIILAFHNYHDTFRGLPAEASTDKEGKKLLSWRVYILPYIEQDALFRQFHLDEPWDSEHNKKLIEHMPQVYRNPRSKAPKDTTTYLAVVGKNMGFEEPKPTPEGKKVKFPTGLGFRDFTDGTSNTALVVEANDDDAVIWTKPDDLEVILDDVMNGLGEAQPGGFNVGFADGSIRFIPKNIAPRVLKLIFQRNDGQVVPEF